MNAYRVNYTPEPLPRRAGRGPLIARAGIVALTLATWMLVAVLMRTGEPAVITPVRTPDVQVFPVDAIDGPLLAQIRIEAFRAGYASAMQDGCGAGLSAPIAQVRP